MKIELKKSSGQLKNIDEVYSSAKSPINSEGDKKNESSVYEDKQLTTASNVFDDNFYKQNKTTSLREIHDTNSAQQTALEALNYLDGSGMFSSKLNFGDARTKAGLVQLVNGERGTINVDADYDGVKEEINLVDAIAASHDSELDIYIEEQLNYILSKKGGEIKGGFLSEDTVEYLKSKGIQVDKINGRTYTFSLVDSDGNVLEDENGKKGSIIFSDCVIPDGWADATEVNLGSILDTLGYDCVSKADFIGKEADFEKLMSTVESNLQQGLYKGDTKVEEIYGDAQTFSGHFENLSKDITNTNAEFSENDDDIKDDKNIKNDKDFRSSVLKYYRSVLKDKKEEYTKTHEDEKIQGENFKYLKSQAKDAVVKQYGNDAKKVLEKI